MEPQIRRTPLVGEAANQVPVRTTDSELAIIAAAKNGQMGSFELLIERYERKVLLRALRITRNWQDAEDVKQQSILKAFTQLHSFEGNSSFCTWLVRIAINEALMLLRKKRTWHEVPVENACEPDGEIKVSPNARQGPAYGASPDEPYLSEERKKVLYAALEQLTPAIRMAIQLRELEERSTRETARILGISLSATKSRVFQGRRRLRELLNRDPRAHSMWRARTRQHAKRTKDTKRRNRRNIGRSPRCQSVKHSYNFISFPVGASQTSQISLEGGM
jgi:RNA polymerase sigma-70 factor (ECF subfamily)